MPTLFKRGVTLLELLVVLAVVSILSTVAVGVFTKEVTRARIARARQEIRTLEVAIAQYEIDNGQRPNSGRGTLSGGNIVFLDYEGSGFLQLGLRSSYNGTPTAPASNRWQGPYIDWDYNRLGNLSGETLTANPTVSFNAADTHFMDPWGGPYYYLDSAVYPSTVLATRLPAGNPFAATETYFNPSTFQIMSYGPDGTTLPVPERGLAADDISNFRGSDF
jgi:prepilin-type N-terminal cleavage/methylation domain-containing protein